MQGQGVHSVFSQKREESRNAKLTKALDTSD